MQLISLGGSANTCCLQCQTELVFLTSYIPIKCALHQDLKNMVSLISLHWQSQPIDSVAQMRLHYSKGCLGNRESFLVLLIRSGKLHMTEIMTLLIFNGKAFKCVFCIFNKNYQSCSRVPRNILQILIT